MCSVKKLCKLSSVDLKRKEREEGQENGRIRKLLKHFPFFMCVFVVVRVFLFFLK